jgi:excisionase family DNA binding protein
MHFERIGLKQAAERLEVSKDTLWRAIKRKELEAERDHGPSGTQYWLVWSEVEAWWENRKDRKRLEEASQVLEAPQTPTFRSVEVVVPQAPSQVYAAPAAPAVEVFTALEAPAVVPVEVHLQALRLVERAQLQAESLRHELLSTRRVLTEQAESLAEKEALARQAQLLEEENLQARKLWEQEKEQLLAEVKTHRERVNWMEKRVPRWVRGLFGAG